MEKLLMAALKYAVLNNIDKEWMRSRLDGGQFSMLEKCLVKLRGIKGLEKITYSDLKTLENTFRTNDNSELFRGDRQISKGSEQFSMLDQYDTDTVVSTFNLLPPIIVATYFCYGDLKWSETIQSRYALDGISLIDIITNQSVPKGTAEEVASIVYEKIEEYQCVSDL